MAESKKKQQAEEPMVTKPRIDCKTQLIEPIDFSFKDLLQLQDLKNATPRFPSTQGEPKKQDGKFISLGVKLGYNALKDIDGLYAWCSSAFAFPQNLSLIDLSFNCLNNISVELLQFEGLKSLYLHGNKIIDVSEVDKLAKLKNLQALTLHGNPIETLNGCRHYILAKLPLLRHLNFSGISKADRQTATVWTKSNRRPPVVESGEKKVAVRRNSTDDS